MDITHSAHLGFFRYAATLLKNQGHRLRPTARIRISSGKNKNSFSPANRSDCLRVGVVTTSFPVVGFSSSGIFVERLVSSIVKEAEVTVLLPCPDGTTDIPKGKAYSAQFFHYGIKKWQRLAHYPGGIPDVITRRDPVILLLPLFLSSMFVACIRLAGKVDVMHGNWSVPGLISAIAARLRRRPAITTVRGEDINRIKHSKFFRLIFVSLLLMNHYVVVVSEAMQNDLRECFTRWANKIVFISNGVSIDSVENRPAFRLPLRLLTVGSLIRRKRIEIMLSALLQLKNWENVFLRIIGEGPERENLEQIAKKFAVHDHVDFVGTVAPEQVEQHLKWADIFLFTSESEGRPNAVLEAMAAGLPIVATNIPGIREIISSDAGLLCPVGDAQSLALSITKMKDDQVSAIAMGQIAKQRIEDRKMTWSRSAMQYISLYKEVIENVGKRPRWS